MINQCPHCQGVLRFNQEQHSKLSQALTVLEQGKQLTLKCPHCKQAIKIDKLTENSPSAQKSNLQVQPPSPPKLDWLVSGVFDREEKVEDVPMALILQEPSEERDLICESIESVGYQLFIEENPEAAIERMRFVNFSCVVHSTDSIVSLDESPFHAVMCQMNMEKRRQMLYILTGPEFNTLYNLEAMAYSANLTVNTNDLNHFAVILRKAIPEYEELFGPFMEELSVYSKQ